MRIEVVSFVDFHLRLKLFGRCDYTTSRKQRDCLVNLISNANTIEIDFASVNKIDFVFSVFLLHLLDNKQSTFLHLSPSFNEIFHTVSSMQTTHNEPFVKSNFSQYILTFIERFFALFGAWVANFSHIFVNFCQFCGACLYYSSLSVLKPSRIRFKSIAYHINESGFRALPVALLTCFIVSYAIALQGVLQLERMGAPMMSVEIVSKLSLREMGPFILAIVIAGRSSSAFSAQIGVMNLTEENDALKVMNLSLFDYLVLPRLFALVIAMPLLVFLADIVSLFAAMIAINMQTGINFTQYLERFYEFVGISNFWIGVVKAPFFGAAVALVGCFRGIYIKGDTEKVGIETTKSVVNAIFWVIFIDAIFSLITARFNI